MRRLVRQAIIGLAALLATGLADPVGAAMRRREARAGRDCGGPSRGGAPHGDCLAQQSACHDL